MEKKILPKHFQAVRDERKNFELRKDEDNIQPGDVLILMEWENGEYTGRTEVRRIRYVLRDVPEYGLMQGYCIIGWKFRKVEVEKMKLMITTKSGDKMYYGGKRKDGSYIITENVTRAKEFSPRAKGSMNQVWGNIEKQYPGYKCEYVE